MIIENIIKIEQTNDNSYNFYYTKMLAKDLINNSETLRLSESKDGIQRFLDLNRVKNISEYCEKEDAIFPTPIILSLNTDFIKSEFNKENSFEINEQMKDLLGNPFSIIDGQHRIEGIKHHIKNSNNPKNFDLPVIIYLDADLATSANIFVTINSNQRAVDKSIIYELFGIMYENKKIYTIESFANQVVKLLNGTHNSPFNNSIKILGRRQNANEFISQGTIAKKIIERISNPTDYIKDNIAIEKNIDIRPNPKKIFRNYFAHNKPEIVAKILINYFTAFSMVFDELWKDDNYITKKAIGFSGLMKLLDIIFAEEDNLKIENLIEIFERMKEINYEKIKSSLENRGSSESIASSIGDELGEVYKEQKIKH